MNSRLQRSVPAPVAYVPEPIFVFGSGMSRDYKEGTAAVAAQFYQAKLGVTMGENGDAYAIPFRSVDNKLLSVKALSEHVNDFMKFARAKPDKTFRISRIACDRNGYTDKDIAPMFRAAPANCALPALWQRELGAADIARVLVYDPPIRLNSSRWREPFKAYLRLNMPLWGASKCELLSIESSRGASAIVETAKQLGCPHREIQANPQYYGADQGGAAELLAVWHATQMVSISGPRETVLPSHSRILRIALRDGVTVDDLNLV